MSPRLSSVSSTSAPLTTSARRRASISSARLQDKTETAEFSSIFVGDVLFFVTMMDCTASTEAETEEESDLRSKFETSINDEDE